MCFHWLGTGFSVSSEMWQDDTAEMGTCFGRVLAIKYQTLNILDFRQTKRDRRGHSHDDDVRFYFPRLKPTAWPVPNVSAQTYNPGSGQWLFPQLPLPGDIAVRIL